MIISQTPYRVSFAGGGTDLPAFYREEYGAVLSTTIGRYMYVNVHRRFEPTYRIAYSVTELTEDPASIRHELVREALKVTEIDEPIEVTTIGDVPAGTGMGSSSTLTVGLLNAFYAYSGKLVSADKLSREACCIEIETLGKPIGRQDQYAAAYGGLNFIKFMPDDSVIVEPVPCTQETRKELESRVLLVYTNQTRSADGILQKQSDGMGKQREKLCTMRDLAYAMRDAISGKGDLDLFAELLNEGWHIKRSQGYGISDPMIDSWYEAAMGAGAQGGKLLGAGGGGFVLLLAPPDKHDKIREALKHPKELDFSLEHTGSRIIYFNQ